MIFDTGNIQFDQINWEAEEWERNEKETNKIVTPTVQPARELTAIPHMSIKTYVRPFVDSSIHGSFALLLVCT